MITYQKQHRGAHLKGLYLKFSKVFAQSAIPIYTQGRHIKIEYNYTYLKPAFLIHLILTWIRIRILVPIFQKEIDVGQITMLIFVTAKIEKRHFSDNKNI